MEIEYKLAPAPRERFEAVLRDGALNGHLSPPRTLLLHAVYYDTPDCALARAHIMLRLRTENGVGVCTVKAPSGLQHARLEYERPARTAADGVRALLDSGELPEFVAQALRSGAFAPCGEARFTRTVHTLTMPDFSCEVCGDYGTLSACGRSEPVCELELELLQGNAAALHALALRLSRDYDLPLSSRSKSARVRALREKEHE
ncbi:MAG: CYTH domain-containing protein [Clostridia bacterium]|nr:CYTH domain-containing protein [Clostridia bacterium]